MSEQHRDTAIKLFGRTIPLAEAVAGEPDKVICEETKVAGNNNSKPEVLNDAGRTDRVSSCSNNGRSSSQDDRVESGSKSEEVKTEEDISDQEKLLKKPDKILPCPRCNSMETKFCYYNNYNVNQPRHFCKNCQRYWTAGGSMRNVPVGAGRRKNKHASPYRHIMLPSNGMVAAHGDVSDLMHRQALPCGPSVPVVTAKANEPVLKFRPEAPLCESMATVLNIAEQKQTADFCSVASGDNREEQSCASSMTAADRLENGGSDSTTVSNEKNATPGYCNGVNLPHMQCYPPGAALMFPWSPAWSNAASISCGSENGIRNPVPWTPSPTMMTTAGFCGPAVPFPMAPPSFWSCMPGWPNGVWSVPWGGCNGGGMLPASPASNFSSSANGSPTLGKHSRDACSKADDEEKAKKNLWVPKTLRIDDPDEAAKSSIWATLGIKADENRIFKPFQSKLHKNGQASESSHALHANPAALSRSQSFQETT